MAYNKDVGGRKKELEIQVDWTHPPTDWFKLNMDGAVKKRPRLAGYGGVLRDHCGRWVAGFGANLGIVSVTEAELWGLYYGLQMAWTSGHKRLIVKMDSQVALNLITQDLAQTHPLRVIVVCCQQMLSRDWVVKFNHTLREGNRVADSLANWSLQQGIGIHKIHDPPQEILLKLWKDTLGVTMPRWTIDCN